MTFLKEAQKVWDMATLSVDVRKFNVTFDLQKRLLDFMHVGPFYFYFFDLRQTAFRYISPEMESVLGYDPKRMTVPIFLSKIHPDDQAVFLNFEKEIVGFFKTLPSEKISKYKVSYDYRVQHAQGHYVRLLQQFITVEFDDENNVLVVLGIHTDITHIKKGHCPILSFIGLDGEPSYIDVEVEKTFKECKETFTKREKQVLALMLQGASTEQIAKSLFVSKHTITTHRKNILCKTETKNTIELLVKVISEGLI